MIPALKGGAGVKGLRKKERIHEHGQECGDWGGWQRAEVEEDIGGINGDRKN